MIKDRKLYLNWTNYWCFLLYICVWNRILSVGKKIGGFLHEIEIR